MYISCTLFFIKFHQNPLSCIGGLVRQDMDRQIDERIERRPSWFLHTPNLLAGGLSWSWSYDSWIDTIPFSSTNKTDRHNLTQILLKLALSTTKPNNTSKWGTFILNGINNIGMPICFYVTQPCFSCYSYIIIFIHLNILI